MKGISGLLKKIFVSILLILLISPQTFAQINLFQKEVLLKYWYYRDRLKYFVIPGENRGEADMAGVRNRLEINMDGEPNIPAPPENMDFGQNSVYNGYYLGILATEYKLLMNNGNITDAAKTEKQVTYALKYFYNYLDFCEHYFTWNNISYHDGFFIRTDVPKNFTVYGGVPSNTKTSSSNEFFPDQWHKDILNIKLKNDDYFVPGTPSMPPHFGVSDPLPLGHPGLIDNVILGGTPINIEPPIVSDDFYMSQDEAIGYLMGLALVKKYMTSSSTIIAETGQNCSQTATDFALSIIANICGGGDMNEIDHWKIHNPFTGDIRWDCFPFAYGYAAAGNWFSDGARTIDSYFTNVSNLNYARFCWNEIPWLDQTNAVMAMTLASMGSSFHDILGNNVTKERIHDDLSEHKVENFYLLLYQVLHPELSIDNIDIEKANSDLANVTGEGLYNYGVKFGYTAYSGGGWAYSYKWRGTIEEQYYGTTKGNFSGVDFMLFYNLYYVRNGFNYSDYHYYDSFTTDQIWPIQLSDGSIIGSNQQPLDRYAINTLYVQNAEILNSTRRNSFHEWIPEIPNTPGVTNLKAENEIILKPNCFIEKGAKALIKIEPHIVWDNEFMEIDLLMEVGPMLLRGNFNDDNIALKSSVTESDVKDTIINFIHAVSTQKILIFPNPTNGNITIVCNSIDNKYKIINIYNHTVIQGFAKNANFTIDLNGLSPGIYFLGMENGTKCKIIKL